MTARCSISKTTALERSPKPSSQTYPKPRPRPWPRPSTKRSKNSNASSRNRQDENRAHAHDRAYLSTLWREHREASTRPTEVVRGVQATFETRVGPALPH